MSGYDSDRLENTKIPPLDSAVKTHAPHSEHHGGVIGDSGWGSYRGKASFDCFTQSQDQKGPVPKEIGRASCRERV